MDVFLIPFGREEYHIYYEPTDEAPLSPDEMGELGVVARWRQRFSAMLHEAEQERHRPQSAHEPAGFLGRAYRRMMRFLAERVSEWRVLWHLRRADDLRAHTPADLEEDQARRILTDILKRDSDRHTRWAAINLVLLAASAPLALVPGPNVLAYFFTFNVVGRFLAMRGARRGLNDIPWRIIPTPELSDLRAALAQTEPHRERTVHDVATRLHLPHLARFFERIAVPTA